MSMTLFSRHQDFYYLCYCVTILSIWEVNNSSSFRHRIVGLSKVNTQVGTRCDLWTSNI